MKGSSVLGWGSTAGPTKATAGDGDVEMTGASSDATLRRTPFSPAPVVAGRPGLLEPFPFRRPTTEAAAGSSVFAALVRPPSSSGSASSSDQVAAPISSSSKRSSTRPIEVDWSSPSFSASPPAGSGLTISEFLRSDGKPRRRLKKRSRASNQLSSIEGAGRLVDYTADGGQGRSGQDDTDHPTLPKSPRQIIARGMSSLQRTFSLSKGRTPSAVYSPAQQPRSPSSPQAALRRISGFLESRHSIVGPAPLNLESTTQDYFGPYVVSPPPLPPTLRRSPSQTYSNGGFHLPTRRGSSSTTSSSIATSPRVRPKTIASHPSPSARTASMPPPPLPLVPASSRPPFEHSRSTPQTKASLQPTRRPHLLEDDQNQSKSASGLMTETVESRPSSRASNFQRKGHRTSSSVNSIPLQPPAHYDRPMPRLAGSPFLPTSSLPSGEPQRSTSTPPTNGHLGRRNSLSDLRIPPRVANAQKALHERVGAVKEFAVKIQGERRPFLASPARCRADFERAGADLKRLQIQHAELQLGLLTRAGPDRLPSLEGEYEPWWEMAEVLVKLASTNLDEAAISAADNRVSSCSTSSSERARAVTMLARTERIPPATSPSEGPPRASPERWRGSTGRTELSQRQLDVLRGMLTTPVKKLPVSALAGQTRPSHPHNSSAPPPAGLLFGDSLDDRPARPQEGNAGLPQQRRASRAGVKGLKDFLRSLRIGADYPTGDALILNGGERSVAGTIATARSGGTLAAVDSGLSSSAARKSPRRPSLASIFRFGKDGSSERRPKTKVSKGQPGSASRTDVSSPAASESDWERMSVDSQRPTTPGPPSGRVTPRSAYGSIAATSRWKPTVPPPVPPLPPLPIRTAPPDPPAEWPSSSSGRPSVVPDKIELTPESLQPLLLHVREVERHCARCLQQLSARLGVDDSVSVPVDCFAA